MKDLRVVFTTNLDGYQFIIPSSMNEAVIPNVGDEIMIHEMYHEKLNKLRLPKRLTVVKRRFKGNKHPHYIDVCELELHFSDTDFKLYREDFPDRNRGTLMERVNLLY
jgi:hypothetical protein